MPSAAVDTAVKTKLAASWTASPVVGGYAANDPIETLSEPPQNVDAFIVVQYPVVTGEKPVLRGKYFEEGAIRLVLNVKKDVGQSQGLVWAGTLAGLFREYQPGGGFETFVPSTPFINDTNDDGIWLSFSVIVPYRYQHS
jgi:hypothetical protein